MYCSDSHLCIWCYCYVSAPATCRVVSIVVLLFVYLGKGELRVLDEAVGDIASPKDSVPQDSAAASGKKEHDD